MYFEICTQAGANEIEVGARELGVLPQLQDLGLDALVWDVWQVATVLAVVPSIAEPIGVAVAVPASRDGEDKFRSAPAAVQRSGELMASPVGALARLTMCAEYMLNRLERGRINDRFVVTGILDAFPADEAEVVAIAENLVQFIHRQRSCRAFRCGALEQPSCFERCGEAMQTPIASGVLLEGPGDMRCAFGVCVNGADLSAVDRLADVEIADWRNGGGATVHGLLSRTF